MPESSLSHSKSKGSNSSRDKIYKQRKQDSPNRSKQKQKDKGRKKSQSKSQHQDRQRKDKGYQNKKLFVTNIDGKIPQDQVRQELKKQFQVFGTIKEMIIKTRANSTNTYAFIQYQKLQDAQKAESEMNRKKFKGKDLKVQFGKSQRKKNDKESGGCYYCHKDGHFARQCRQKGKYQRHDRHERRSSRSYQRSHKKHRRSYSRSSSSDRHRRTRRSRSPVYNRYRDDRHRDDRYRRNDRDYRDGGRDRRNRSPRYNQR